LSGRRRRGRARFASRSSSGSPAAPGRRRCRAWRGLQQPADTTPRPRSYRPAPPWSRTATAPRPMRYKGRRRPERCAVPAALGTWALAMSGRGWSTGLAPGRDSDGRLPAHHAAAGRGRDADERRARRARPDPPSRIDLGLSAVGAAAILAQDPRPAAVRHRRGSVKHAGLAPRENGPEVSYYLLDSGERTVFAPRTPARKRPPGRQADVVCLSIAAEPCRAVAVLGADLPLRDRDP
jgi:hypothetical protein